MRPINRHIIHASATPNDRDVTAADIDSWHKARGWKGIGYHFVIRRNGRLENGRPVSEVGAHVTGHNKDSIGTCLIGAGLSLSDFTEAQILTLRCLHRTLKLRYPGLTVHGHREYANKSCPGFNVKDFPWEEPVVAAVQAEVVSPPIPLTSGLTIWQRLTQAIFNRKA